MLIDLPKDVTQGPCSAAFVEEVDLPGYAVPTHGDPESIRQAADLLMAAQRPVLYVGHGAVISGAGSRRSARREAAAAPIVNTLLGKGAADETHPLHLGMLGMHGTAYANKAVDGCDCIMAIGARWDDRITGKLDEFCVGATKIHIDIDPSEFGKMVTPDVAIAGDARLVLEELIPQVAAADTDAWLAQCDAWRRKYPLKYAKQGGLRAQHVLDRLHVVTEGNAVITTDVGQHQMWAAQFCLSTTNRHWISSGGAGTMGFGFPAAIGAQLGCPDKKVWAVCGDGGFQMTQMELATAQIHSLQTKCLIINNNFLGMVRQWQEMFFEERLFRSRSRRQPRFREARAGLWQSKPSESAAPPMSIASFTEAQDYDEGPCVVVAEVVKEDNVFPMIPAGAPLSGMLTEKPQRKARQAHRAVRDRSRSQLRPNQSTSTEPIMSSPTPLGAATERDRDRDAAQCAYDLALRSRSRLACSCGSRSCSRAVVTTSRAWSSRPAARDGLLAHDDHLLGRPRSTLEQIIKQLAKLVDVVHAIDHTGSDRSSRRRSPS